MKTIFLTDGTVIENCIDSSSPNDILAFRESYADAGAVRDAFTDENTGAIRIVSSDGSEETSGNLKLLAGCTIFETEGGLLCEIHLRTKTEIEVLSDEVAELQEAIIGE